MLLGSARYRLRLSFSVDTPDSALESDAVSAQSERQDVALVRRVDSSTRYRIRPPSSTSRPSSPREHERSPSGIADTTSSEAYKDLGGLDAAIQELANLVRMPLLRPDVFTSYGENGRVVLPRLHRRASLASLV